MRKFKLHRAGSLLLCPVTVLLCAVTVSCNRKVGKDTLKSVSIPAGALYNGIVIPEDWVYGADSQNGLPGTVPYGLLPVRARFSGKYKEYEL